MFLCSQLRKWAVSAVARHLGVTDTSVFRQPRKYLVNEPHLSMLIRRDDSAKLAQQRQKRMNGANMGVANDAGRCARAALRSAVMGSLTTQCSLSLSFTCMSWLSVCLYSEHTLLVRTPVLPST